MHIDSSYMDFHFNKWLAREKGVEDRASLTHPFSQEDQKYADVFISDIQSDQLMLNLVNHSRLCNSNIDKMQKNQQLNCSRYGIDKRYSCTNFLNSKTSQFLA